MEEVMTIKGLIYFAFPAVVALFVELIGFDKRVRAHIVLVFALLCALLFHHVGGWSEVEAVILFTAITSAPTLKGLALNTHKVPQAFRDKKTEIPPAIPLIAFLLLGAAVTAQAPGFFRSIGVGNVDVGTSPSYVTIDLADAMGVSASSFPNRYTNNTLRVYVAPSDSAQWIALLNNSDVSTTPSLTSKETTGVMLGADNVFMLRAVERYLHVARIDGTSTATVNITMIQ